MQFLHRCGNSTVLQALGQALHLGITALQTMVVIDHRERRSRVRFQRLLAVRQRHHDVV